MRSSYAVFCLKTKGFNTYNEDLLNTVEEVFVFYGWVDVFGFSWLVVYLLSLRLPPIFTRTVVRFPYTTLCGSGARSRACARVGSPSARGGRWRSCRRRTRWPPARRPAARRW